MINKNNQILDFRETQIKIHKDLLKLPLKRKEISLEVQIEVVVEEEVEVEDNNKVDNKIEVLLVEVRDNKVNNLNKKLKLKLLTLVLDLEDDSISIYKFLEKLFKSVFL